jgi:hypothetical protein
MTRRLLVLVGAAFVGTPCVLPAQQNVVSRVRVSSFYESYSVDSLFAFSKISELTIPVGIDLALGRIATATLSSGFVRADLTSAGQGLADQSLSGLLDTEVRLSVNVFRGRLLAVVSGAIPTGIRSVKDSAVSVLGAIASDVIGFAVPTLGSGGGVGGGLVGALPVGRMALGIGATYTYPLSYQPVVGRTAKIKPGAELRARAGLEGPLGRKTYLRTAGVVALRQKDVLADTTRPGIGARVIGYLEVTQGLGNMQLTLYGFDVYRSSAQWEGTPVGGTALPKGNLVVGGLRYAIALGRSFEITPKVEYRYSRQAPGAWTDTSNPPDGTVDGFVEGPLEKAGTSFRFGLDLRQQLAQHLAVVLTGSGLLGSVRQAGTDVGLNGYRAGLLLDFTP